MRPNATARHVQGALPLTFRIFHATAPVAVVAPAEPSPQRVRTIARIMRARQIARACSLVRGGSTLAAACREVGLAAHLARHVRRRCDELGIPRRRCPLAPTFRTSEPWPMFVRPRAR